MALGVRVVDLAEGPIDQIFPVVVADPFVTEFFTEKSPEISEVGVPLPVLPIA